MKKGRRARRKTMKYSVRLTNNKVIFTIFSLIICLLFQINLFSQEGSYTEYLIKGRVIDENNQPLPNVFIDIISLIVYGTYETYQTDADGRFSVIKRVKKGNTLYLYVSGGKITGRTLIDAPFQNLNKFNQHFVGQPIIFGEETVIDVGDVKVQFWFADVNIRFRHNQKNLSRKQWESLWMVLKDENGKSVWEETVGPTLKKEVDLTKSEIKLAFPEGKWKLEFQKFDWKTAEVVDSTVIGETPYFVIDKNKPVQAIDVITRCSKCLK